MTFDQESNDIEILADMRKRQLIDSVDWLCAICEEVYKGTRYERKRQIKFMGVKHDPELLIRHEKRLEKIRKRRRK